MNPLLSASDETSFRVELLGGLGAYPTYYDAMAPINRAGPAVLGRPALPPRLDVAGFAAAVSAGAHVVDGRPRAEFAAGHLPGSINIELTDTFASYVGWFVPFGAAVALVLPEPHREALEEATVQLFRIGYDRVVGALTGGLAAWAASGARIETYPTTTIEALHEQALAGRNAYALDVRDPHEWREDGGVPGAIRIPLGDLSERLATIPRDAPVTVMCKSGARASIAASLLDAAGLDVRLIDQGGAPDWPATSPRRGGGRHPSVTTAATILGEDHARRLDAADPLAGHRDRFLLPTDARRNAQGLPGRTVSGRPAGCGSGRGGSGARRVGTARRRRVVRREASLARRRRRDP